MHVKCPLFSSVVIVMLSLGVGRLYMVFQLYPIQELPEYTLVLRHKRHSHLSMLKIEVNVRTKLPSGHNAVPPFLSGFPFAKPGSGYDLVALCSARPLTCMRGCSCFRFGHCSTAVQHFSEVLRGFSYYVGKVAHPSEANVTGFEVFP